MESNQQSRKAKQSLALSKNFLLSVQPILFLDHVLLLAELAQEFKIAVQRSDSMKQNFREFTFFIIKFLCLNQIYDLQLQNKFLVSVSDKNQRLCFGFTILWQIWYSSFEMLQKKCKFC